MPAEAAPKPTSWLIRAVTWAPSLGHRGALPFLSSQETQGRQVGVLAQALGSLCPSSWPGTAIPRGRGGRCRMPGAAPEPRHLLLVRLLGAPRLPEPGSGTLR